MQASATTSVSQRWTNFCSMVGKHCENRKTLPWEHHIGWKMCQIALSKLNKNKKKTVETAVTVVTVVRKTTQPLHKKSCCMILFVERFCYFSKKKRVERLRDFSQNKIGLNLCNRRKKKNKLNFVTKNLGKKTDRKKPTKF